MDDLAGKHESNLPHLTETFDHYLNWLSFQVSYNSTDKNNCQSMYKYGNTHTLLPSYRQLSQRISQSYVDTDAHF